MKKQILFAGMILFSIQMYAQKAPHRFDYYAASTLDSIGATAEQKAKVAELVEYYGPKNSAIWKDDSLSDEQKKVKVKTNKAAQSKEYNSILTADQKRKLKEYKERFDQRQQKQ